uniref:Odorant-binding protein 11 n=1 Tax=Heortia vitessoides TaxID=1557813 RepID=A0A978W7A4_9NEOP|nr:odorant-binding protein 11 [Heortia vitessoides]
MEPTSQPLVRRRRCEMSRTRASWATWALCLAVVIAWAHCLDDDTAELVKMLHEDCVEETGVDESLIDKVNAGAFLMPDPKLKCYIKCVMVTVSMMVDGEVDVETVLAMIDEKIKVKYEQELRMCGTKKGVDDCDTAFLTQLCWQTHGKDEYYLI